MGSSNEARARRKLVGAPGLKWVRRPVTPEAHDHFDLAYVRVGPRGGIPLVVLPGGPGLASLRPYRALRADAVARGLDIIMIEHRGVGLSRADDQNPPDQGN